MKPSLATEIREFLQANGPATAPEIALAIRSRRALVDVALAGGGFERVSPPDGTTGRGVYWNASQLVLKRHGPQSRAALMLSVLSDGRWHSRMEIFDRAGGFILTNNAAIEIRRDFGRDVEFDWGTGRVPMYRLVALDGIVAA